MHLTLISDTHGLHRELPPLSGEVLIHAGDMCNVGKEQELLDFLLWFGELNFKHKLLIGGNHDFLADKEPARFRSLLPPAVVYLQDCGHTIDGIKFWGSPVTPGLEGWAFGRSVGPAMRAHWRLVPDDIDVLITHTPPAGILDRSSRGRSLGCTELKKELVRIRPQLHIFGHVHNSYGEVLESNICFINASNLNSREGLVNPIVELDFHN